MYQLNLINTKIGQGISLSYLLVIIFMIPLLIGCQEILRPKMPEKIIMEEKMAEILTDAYIGNAARSNNNRVLRLGGVQLDSIIYARYDIDSLQFATNASYYSAQIDPYLRILERVEQNISTIKKSLDSLALLDAEKQKLDKKALLDSANSNQLRKNLVPRISQ